MGRLSVPFLFLLHPFPFSSYCSTPFSPIPIPLSTLLSISSNPARRSGEAQRRNASQLQKLEGIKCTHFGELYTTKMNSLLAVDALIPTGGRDSVCAHRCRYESGFSTRLRFSLRTVTKVCRKLSQVIQ